MYNQIQEWPKAARGAIAADAVKALALNGRAGGSYCSKSWV